MKSYKNSKILSCPTVGQKGIEYLLGRESWKGKGGFSLDKMAALMQALGNPQDSYRAVHIAGTNGKGSVSAATSAILAASGARVGMYTSPHLDFLNERIAIDGRPIEGALLGEVAEQVSVVDARLGLGISFFEAMTACSFLAFQSSKVDWGVFEVGLGGRLDATNIISRPAACGIVTIDYDHQDILGNSLSEIAKEKAGIIKSTGHPTVIGSLPKEATEVISKLCKAQQSPLYKAGQDFSWNAWNEVGFLYASKKLGEVSFLPALSGPHQGHNMSIAITLGRLLDQSLEHCRHGVEHCFWPGRLEKLQVRGALCLIDCAHNPAGISALINHIRLSNLTGFRLVFGALNTKNWKEMVSSLRPYVDEWWLLDPDSEMAVSASSVAEYLSSNGVSRVRLPKSYEEAADSIRLEPKPTVVTGSIYMVGKLRSLLVDTPLRYWEPRSTRSTS